MCPECHNQKHGRDRSCNEKPWTITSPFRFGFICQSTHNRIIDRIPKSRKQHQGRDCCHTDSEYVCVKNHEKITDEHPAEITSYIAKSICDFTDQRNFYIFVFTLHNSSCLLPSSVFPFTHVFSTAVFFIISLSYIMLMYDQQGILFFLHIDNHFHCSLTVIVNVLVCFQIIFKCKCLRDQRS